MTVSPGTRIGAYEVLAKLGEGGMGEVYRARDTSLNRDVAIKVLPASVANDPERLARFEREAKLLASLSHSNIAQVYGLERPSTGSGQAALVMELAPGDDLTVYVQRGAMSLHDALPVATQIAHALEAAHERGIVHRDLKPANIKVTADGAVKVLDFGLAKALDPAAASGSANAMNSPTLTAQATAAGIILGTAAYMSPEQARGRDADKRADVWAFGVVFFEMLTGRRLFEGETISDTLAAVLRQDIPWSALPPGTPAELTRLLRRCLERDRKNRLHDIADARIVLEEIARGGAKEETVVPVQASRRPWWLLGAAAVALLALAFLAGRWTASPSTATTGGTVRLTIHKPAGVTYVGSPAVAPDGSFVVFVGRSGSKGQRLYLQRLDQTAPQAIERTEGASQPLVSPDGRWIAYQRTTRLEKIAVDGGEPLPITTLEGGLPGGAWVPGGPIVFSTSWLTGLSAVSPEGGPVRSVSTLDTSRGEIGHWFPNPLPDGRHLLMSVWVKGSGTNDADVALLDLNTGKHRVLFKGVEARYLSPGFIIYFRAGTFHAIRFDPATLAIAGEPARVLDDAYGNSPEGEPSQTDLSSSGTLAYLSGPNILTRELLWVSAGGKTENLPFPARPYTPAALAPDGKRIAVGVIDAGRHVVRLLDLERRTDDVLDLPGSNWDPVWHPDGKRLAFLSMQKGDFDAYWKDVSTTGPPEPLLVTEFDDIPEAFLSDDASMLIRQSDKDGRYLIKRLPLSPRGTPVTLVPFSASAPEISRDGRFMAFVSARTGSDEIYIQPLVGGTAAEKISTAGGTVAAWTRDGRELLYLRPPEIMAVTLATDGQRLRPVSERIWARVEGNYHDELLEVGTDGRALVAIDRNDTKREIRVIVNWQHEVAKKIK